MCHYSHSYCEFLQFNPPEVPVSVSEKIVQWECLCRGGPGIIEIVNFKEMDGNSGEIFEKTVYITQGYIQEIINDFLSFIEPKIVRSLPKIILTVNDILRDSENCLDLALGKYQPSSYPHCVNINLSSHGFLTKNNPIPLLRETIFHELSHWLFENSDSNKKKVIIEYFIHRISQGRSKESLRAKLEEQRSDEQKKELHNKYFGFSDNFGVSNDPDDSAGRVYENDFDDSDNWGREFVSEHLSKLALTPNEFQCYFNSKGENGVSYWKDAFNKCKSLFVL